MTNGDLVVGQNYSFTYDLVVPIDMPAGIINNSGAVAFVEALAVDGERTAGDLDPGTAPGLERVGQLRLAVEVGDVVVDPDVEGG